MQQKMENQFLLTSFLSTRLGFASATLARLFLHGLPEISIDGIMHCHGERQRPRSRQCVLLKC